MMSSRGHVLIWGESENKTSFCLQQYRSFSLFLLECL